MTSLLDLTDRTFDEELLSSPVPVIAEFWAAWCPPCRAMAPVLEALAEESVGERRFVRVNADEQPELARRYEVGSVPTFLVLVEGEVRARLVGARSRARFLEEIEAAVR